jgi:hypothetical protein
LAGIDLQFVTANLANLPAADATRIEPHGAKGRVWRCMFGRPPTIGFFGKTVKTRK